MRNKKIVRDFEDSHRSARAVFFLKETKALQVNYHTRLLDTNGIVWKQVGSLLVQLFLLALDANTSNRITIKYVMVKDFRRRMTA